MSILAMYTFNKIETPSILLPVLKSRHPQSCFVYNQVKLHEKFQEKLVFYIVGNEITENTWIVSNNFRKDYGVYTCISAPRSVIEGNNEIDEEIKQCFSSPANGVIDWDNGVLFVGMEKPVSRMIYDISANIKGNVTEVHPSHLYYMEIDDALKIEDRVTSSVEVRRLDAAKQEENFILAGWKYAKPGSDEDIQQCIQLYPSGGVVVEGKCVAGVYISGYGLLSALYTLPEERKKGYGKLAMNFAIKESARDGCIPCLTVEQRNTRSVQFNESLGVKFVSLVDWMDVLKLEVD